VSIAEVRPVTYFAVANPNKVGESIAGQVCQKNRLRAVRENELRPFFLVQGLWQTLPFTKSQPGERFVPLEHIALTNQQVGEAVPCQIDEFEFGIAPIKRWQ
jgi:hypothetical protein